MTSSFPDRLSEEEAERLRDARIRLLPQRAGEMTPRGPTEGDPPSQGPMPGLAGGTQAAGGPAPAGTRLGVERTLAIGSVAGPGMVAMLWWLNHQGHGSSP